MPLVICPDCGHQCSPSAAACTDCGRPIAGAVAPPAVAKSIAALSAVPAYGKSIDATLCVAVSILLGAAGLVFEWATGRPPFGAYILAILFGIWARLAQAHAHHRAVIDSIRQP